MRKKTVAGLLFAAVVIFLALVSAAYLDKPIVLLIEAAEKSGRDAATHSVPVALTHKPVFVS